LFFSSPGYGDTIIASNPFDDTPPSHSMMHQGPGPMSGQGPGGMGGPPGMGGGPPGMMSHMNMGGMNGMNHSGHMGGPMGNHPMGNMNNMGHPMSMGPSGPMGHPGGHPGPGGPGGPMGPMGSPACNVFGQPNSGPQGPPKPMPVSAGKIYPPDQPMVFNPQNPNAPPIYPCGICHKEVHDNDQAILCESGCNFWFHRFVLFLFPLNIFNTSRD